MVVGTSNIIEYIWETFRDRLTSQVTSVQIDDKGITNGKTITINSTTSTFPESAIDSKSDYPILVVETPSINSQYFTGKRDLVSGTIAVSVYTTNAPSADKFMSQIYTVVESYKNDFTKAGIEQIHIDSSDSDSAQRQGFVAHVRTVTFSFKSYINKTW